MDNALFQDEQNLRQILDDVRDFALSFRGTTPAALAGDWLASAVDHNPQSVSEQGDVSAAIELATVVDDLVQRLSDRGRYFMTPTTMNGTRGIRAAFVNWQNDPAQVLKIMAELNTALQNLSTAPAAAPE